KLANCDRKLKALLALHLDDGLSVEEYRAAKAEVLFEKLTIQEQITGVKAGDISTWFEPANHFVKSLKRSDFTAIHTATIEEQRDFLKTTGSNLLIHEKALTVEFKEPWKAVENHGRFAQSDTAALLTGAAVFGETGNDFTEAERGRFELPNGFHHY